MSRERLTLSVSDNLIARADTISASREIVSRATISQLVSESYFDSRLDFSARLSKRARGAKPERFVLVKSLAYC